MKTVVYKNNSDTGLRGTSRGRLFVDKKVFFNRKKVKDLLEELKSLEVVKVDQPSINQK